MVGPDATKTKNLQMFKPHLGLPFGNLQDKGLSLGLIMVDLHHYFMGWSTQTWIQPLSSCEISALDISWSLKFFPSTPEKKKTHSALQEKHTNTPLVDFSQIPQIVWGGLPYTNQDPTLINLNNVNLRPNSSCELRTSEARPRSCTSPEIPPETVWPKWSGWRKTC